MENFPRTWRRRPRVPVIEYPVVLGPTDANINLNGVALRATTRSKRGYGVFARRPVLIENPSPIILEAPMFTFMSGQLPYQISLAETWKHSELFRREVIIDHLTELAKLNPARPNASW